MRIEGSVVYILGESPLAKSRLVSSSSTSFFSLRYALTTKQADDWRSRLIGREKKAEKEEPSRHAVLTHAAFESRRPHFSSDPFPESGNEGLVVVGWFTCFGFYT